MIDAPLASTRFDRFDLPEPVLQGLRAAGFESCTPIQALSLPLALLGRDIAGQAQTGTGKTAAFLVAAFNRLLRQEPPSGRSDKDLRMLVLAPTRELAIQIHKDALQLGAHTGLRFALAYGGTGYEQQRDVLTAGADVLIGTPGRIIDYHKQRVFGLKRVEVVVLDEADRMFDLGFIKDIRFLLRRCSPPEQRQSMLFSATLSWRVMELAYEFMNNPEQVQVEAETMTADRVRQAVYFPSNDQKLPLLVGLARDLKPERAMIFVNTKHWAERVRDWLNANGLTAALLSGDVPQAKRTRLLSQFALGKFAYLVATDVAARGLHIPDVTHVFNFDLPQSGEDYVHRIGRTARAGADGDAISFACEDSAFYLPEIESYLGQRIPVMRLDPERLPTLIRPVAAARRRPERGGGKPALAADDSGQPRRPRRRSRQKPKPKPGTDG